MAMGIDAYTGGIRRPKGCKVRMHTGDTKKGLTLRQVAEVAQEKYDVRIAVRTSANTISPASAVKQARRGRGFVLQGNTEALLGTASQSTKKPANHAVWVQGVEGGTEDVPEFAIVFDPAADGRQRHPGPGNYAQGPQRWPWDRVLAFAAGLRLDDAGTKKLGSGRFYAGFIPHRASDPGPGLANAVQPVPDVTLRHGARATVPFPDRTRANPPKGRRVNVRSRPDRLDPDDVVDRVSDGALFIAYQRTSHGIKPPGSKSPTWFGNRDGTEWIHVSGLRRIGGQG